MNNRLVWNFEIDNPENKLPEFPSGDKEELRWEVRYFWPGDAIIRLKNLASRFLELSNAKCKHREDCYYLLPNSDYNIKLRRNELVYKPLLAEQKNLKGFGKKIQLTQQPPHIILPGTPPIIASELLELIDKHSRKIWVEKEAVIYKLPCDPILKLELSKLEVEKQLYFSVCIEGYCAQLVNNFGKLLVSEQRPFDYIHFLKTINEHDH